MKSILFILNLNSVMALENTAPPTFHTRVSGHLPLQERRELAYNFIAETRLHGQCAVCFFPIRPANIRLHIFKHLSIKKGDVLTAPTKVALLPTSRDLETLLADVADPVLTCFDNETRDAVADNADATGNSVTDNETGNPFPDKYTVIQFIRCYEWTTLSLQAGACLLCSKAITSQDVAHNHMLAHIGLSQTVYDAFYTNNVDLEMILLPLDLPVTVVSRLSLNTDPTRITIRDVIAALRRPASNVAIDIAVYDSSYTT